MPREPLFPLSGPQLTISIYKPTVFYFRKVETKSDLNPIFNILLIPSNRRKEKSSYPLQKPCIVIYDKVTNKVSILKV